MAPQGKTLRSKIHTSVCPILAASEVVSQLLLLPRLHAVIYPQCTCL